MNNFNRFIILRIVSYFLGYLESFPLPYIYIHIYIYIPCIFIIIAYEIEETGDELWIYLYADCHLIASFQSNIGKTAVFCVLLILRFGSRLMSYFTRHRREKSFV